MLPLSRRFPDPRALLLCGTALVAAAPAFAQAPNARPQGGVVSAGSATIAQDAARTQVNQATDRAVIDWRGFDVGRDHAVRFQQPNSGSMTLNRVNAADPSRIAGQVTANGGIVIVNPSGVIFAPGARVEAQSVIVSTADTANQRFMAGGRMVFDRPGRADARIVNEGTITARDAGIAALVAPQVANRGVINARLGTVAIAGAETHVIDLYGDGLMSIEITGAVRQRPADGGALVTNEGTLAAEGGRVSLTAAAADGIVQTLVRAGGRISAGTDAATGRRGEVVIAGTGGAVIIEGEVTARGLAAGQRGGTIEVVADRVLATGTARIDASGTAGGGEIAFGQTRQGSAAPRRAARTGVAEGAELRADATVLGQGGRVVIHSTDTTLMAGTISARGGPQGGDGGFVEVSGERGFRVTGAIDVSAPAGRSGEVLFDPANLTIRSTSGDEDPPADISDGILGFGETLTLAYVTPAQVAAFTGNLTLQATNNITVQEAVTKPSGNLTLQTAEGGTIDVNAPLRVLGGDLTLIANDIEFRALTEVSGTLTVQAAGGFGGTGPAGNVAIAAADGRIVANRLTQTGDLSFGSITLFSFAGGAVNNDVRFLGNLRANDFIEFRNVSSLTVDGTVARTTPVTSSGSISIYAGGGDLTVTGTVDARPSGTSTGSFSLRASGSVTIASGATVRGVTGEGSSTIAAAVADPTAGTNTALAGGVTLAGTVNATGLNLSAGQGGIVQTGGSVTASSLNITSGGDARLDAAGAGTPNAVGTLFASSATGSFVLDNGSTSLTVAGAITGANIGIITTGTLTLQAPPSPTAGGTAGSLSAPSGRVSLRVGDLAIPTSAFGSGTRVRGATVEIAPATGRDMQVAVADAAVVPAGTFALRNATLALIEATGTYRFGGTTFGGVTTATATSLALAGPITFAGTLDLRSLGTVSQAAGADLSIGALAGAAGGAVSLTNAGNSIGFLDDFSAGGGFALNAAAITLRGLLSAPGQLVSLATPGAIQNTGAGRIEAGEFRATAGGAIALTGANRLDRLGQTSAGGALTLVNTSPLLTIPGGQTVQSGGAGSITANGGSITVDGTIRAPSLSLSAPAGSVTVNGFSAIAFAGQLSLTAQNVVTNGLIAGSTGISIIANTLASLAGTAQGPSLIVESPLIQFGGLNAAGSEVRLRLGASGIATGTLTAGALDVLNGRGATLRGSIEGDATRGAAARGDRFLNGVELGDPPPNQFNYLFNGCPIGASVCGLPFLPTDNPRALLGELDPAGQPPANPLVQLPVLPFVTQAGRDTSEDRELAPPNIRAEDF
jgi:filamentous hemagglutinin family protein